MFEHRIADHSPSEAEGNRRTGSSGDANLVGSSEGNSGSSNQNTIKVIKQLLKSKTIRVALVQAAVGIIIALQSNSAEFKSLGILTTAKTVLDIYLRMNTTISVQEIK